MTSPRVVTDHAVLRFLERRMGLDVEAARDEIARICASALDRGACGVLVDGLEYRIEDGRVVTVQRAVHPSIRTGIPKRRREIEE